MDELRPLAICSDYADLHAALRARSDQLGATREGLDEAMRTLPDGYASKLLAPVPIKGIGKISMSPLLAALGLKLVVVEDHKAIEQISKRARVLPNAGDGMPAMGNGKRRRRRYPKLGAEWGRLMRSKQILQQSYQKRRAIAQIAAEARWQKQSQLQASPSPRVSDSRAIGSKQ